MVLVGAADARRVIGVIARLGALAFERTPLNELTEHACTSAAEALDCPVSVDERPAR